jgi:hypothetical protein
MARITLLEGELSCNRRRGDLPGSFNGETWNRDSNREVAKDAKVLLDLNP